MKCHAFQNWMVSLGFGPQASFTDWHLYSICPSRINVYRTGSFLRSQKFDLIFYKFLQIILNATEAVLAIYIFYGLSTVEYQRVYQVTVCRIQIRTRFGTFGSQDAWVRSFRIHFTKTRCRTCGSPAQRICVVYFITVSVMRFKQVPDTNLKYGTGIM